MTAETTPPKGVRTTLQLAALGVAVLFVLVGIAGFVPGVTTNYDELEIAGHDSEAQLLGVFQVSILHNVVHLLFGLAGLVMSGRVGLARMYLIVGGLIYAVLFVYGLVVDHDSQANFVPLDEADNWLHFGLAVGMVTLGVFLAPAGDRDDFGSPTGPG